MTTIYLSSTYEDLKEYRQAVFDLLRKSQYRIMAMEDYVAADQRPVDKCLKDVEEADLYVGLFAFRYGYVPPPDHHNPHGLSITELEFRRAEALHKQCLIFVLKEDTPWPRTFDDAHESEEKGKRIKALREYLRTEETISFFSQPHELAGLVVTAVKNELDQRKSETANVPTPPTPPTITWNIEKDKSPYPGLMYFSAKYAPVFFGREAEVRAILDRMLLPKGRFIIVSGDSGTGKSSVIGAGVAPHIEKGSLQDTKQALCVRMLPGQGHHPFAALMGALNPFATKAGLKPDIVADGLRQAPDGLSRAIEMILTDGTDCDALVLFMDQMEEIFTKHAPAASKAFLKALFDTAYTPKGPLYVLATIRSDHLHHCHAHPEMLQVLRGPGHYPLGPIEPFLLEDVIANPAYRAGLTISLNLVRRILHEIRSQGQDGTSFDQSNLPLLAFVLNHLYDNRTDHELSETVYQQVGGVAGAIAHHAAAVEAELQRRQGSQSSVRLAELFESLVIVNADGLPTRRRPLVAEFQPGMRESIEFLVEKRLLRIEGEANAATVSISHEKLFEAWPSLKMYVDKNKTQLFGRTLLEGRAKKWVEMKKHWSRGLASSRECREYFRSGVTLTPEMKEYLGASRRKQWIFRIALTVAASLILGTTWLWQKGYSLDQAGLKVQSLFVSIHRDPEMVPIPKGTFQQGDVEGLGESWRNPVREVTIQPFAMGKYEVTFEEYDRFAIDEGKPLPNDQGWGRGRRPVINVSWDNAKAYTKWLSKQTGKRYRLPTEAEWEYAARHGAQQDVWAGTSEEFQLSEYAVFSENSGNRTADVGGKKANAFRLHDLSGNVFEWVEDCWHDTYQGAPADGTVWEEAGGGDCTLRVIRGGSWSDGPEGLRSSNRDGGNTGARYNLIGFRLAQDTP